jgi:hypothetical protein
LNPPLPTFSIFVKFSNGISLFSKPKLSRSKLNSVSAAAPSCSTSSLMSMLTRRRRRLLVLLVGRDLMDVISEQELGRDGRGVGKGRVTCVGVFASSLLGVVDVGEGDLREGWRGGTGGGGRAGGGRGSGRSGGGAFWGISLRCRKREEGRGRE